MSKFLTLAIGGLAAAGALAATLPTAEAQPTGGGGNVCFHFLNVLNSKMADPRTLYLRADGGRTFKIGFSNDCVAGDIYGLILHPTANGGEICNAIDLDVAVRETGLRCVPTSLERLSPEEAAQIPLKYRP
jgi:hypothetical protein